MSLAAPDDIVDSLRDYGLTVLEHPGWRTRSSGYGFDPFGQAWHHDASSEKMSDTAVLAIMVAGRPDLKGPLCNGWIDSDGRVVLVAYGNANHAGYNEADVLARLARGLPPLGDARQDPDRDTVVGNRHLWGWECRNAGDGRDPWDQLDAMERAGAAMCDACSWSPAAQAAHRELTARKIDPAGIDMRAFRADVAAIQTAHRRPPAPTYKERDMLVVKPVDEAGKRLPTRLKDGLSYTVITGGDQLVRQGIPVYDATYAEHERWINTYRANGGKD